MDVPAGVTQEEGHTGGRSHRRKVTQDLRYVKCFNISCIDS